MVLQKVTKSQGDIYYIETLWQIQKLKSIAHSTDLNFFWWDLKISRAVSLNALLKIVS